MTGNSKAIALASQRHNDTQAASYRTYKLHRRIHASDNCVAVDCTVTPTGECAEQPNLKVPAGHPTTIVYISKGHEAHYGTVYDSYPTPTFVRRLLIGGRPLI